MVLPSFFRSAAVPGMCAASIVFALGCGPKQPPRQADSPDPVDPSGESSPSESSGSSSTASTPSRGNDVLAAPPAAQGKGAKGDAPQVSTLAAFTDGLRWGMGHAELTKMFTQTNGVIWKDYDAKLAHARVGPEQVALEAERERVKGGFTRSYIEFKDTPTGYDATGIRGEYTYNNKESLMWIQRQGKKRYFFFINDRLWKIYDEVPLAEGGPLGKTFLDAVNSIVGQVSAQGRVQSPDPAKGIALTTVDWRDGATHLRAVDRSHDGVVAVVVEDSATVANLAALRPNKAADPNEIDPSIKAVTQGTNRTDPNAPGHDAAAPAKKAAPTKKK